ncbi:selenocysteine-tRNA-specific elongation factor [Trypanosoma cruzi]|nr:selenocysteine-tRNA-specific elongation factor [Trypanosoma cruzi]
MFRAFDVTTWAPLIWDEGVSGVVLGLRGAYNYWQQADDQAQLVVDSLFAWMCALEAERDPTDRFMNFGRILLQAFRVRLMTASDPGIPLFNILARLCTAVHEADTFARATQPLAERRGTQISLRCQMCHIYGHDVPTCNVRDKTGGSYSQHGWPLKTAEGLLAASYESGRRQPHLFHHLPPLRTGIASHRRCSTRSFKLPDAIVEKGNGAYPPTTLDCGTTEHRHPRLGSVV